MDLSLYLWCLLFASFDLVLSYMQWSTHGHQEAEWCLLKVNWCMVQHAWYLFELPCKSLKSIFQTQYLMQESRNL